ncbi:tetratricopeptide repeat protein [Thiocapsa sp.]|uniref:tetratricopeptide repeat protein n=1 Tax=Thiocapsa sp. TaxID=2024551 RepID=UPI002B9E3B6B|nr:tetratricopeptide repeat protein [Thiocapsa sp.]HSO83178.1 tetratricopeptide repeat protein [Thiocapsa sp.]
MKAVVSARAPTMRDRPLLGADLPDDLRELLNESISRFKAADDAGAEALLAQLLARVPKHAVAKRNLAAILSYNGRYTEVQQLLAQVVADHPDDLRSRCDLANLVIRDGKLDQADALLKGLAARRRGRSGLGRLS